MYKTN